MEFEIIELPQLTFAGMAVDVRLADVEGPDKPTHALAAAFMKRRAELASVALGAETFGLSTDPEPYDPERDPFEYFVGAEVSNTDRLPDGMVGRIVPAGSYVRFTFRGPAEGAGAVHAYLTAPGCASSLTNSARLIISKYTARDTRVRSRKMPSPTFCSRFAGSKHRRRGTALYPVDPA